jgi:hypothetical protein
MPGVRIVIYVIAAYSLTIGVLALYVALLQHRSRAAAATLEAAAVAPDAAGAETSGPRRGFNLGASLLAPFWMWAHGMRASGATLLLVYLACWQLYQRELWLSLLFVAMIPVAGGAALGILGNRIAASHGGIANSADLSASQLPWSLAGIVLYAFVLPWLYFFANPAS